MKEKEFQLGKSWRRSNERYALSNDQRLTNVDNFIFKDGQIVSLFLIEESISEGFFIFDKMIRDYEKITKNLSLLHFSKHKNGEKNIFVYIIMDKVFKKYTAQILFEFDEKLYCTIFSIEKCENHFEKLIKNNPILAEVVSLIKEQK